MKKNGFNAGPENDFKLDVNWTKFCVLIIEVLSYIVKEKPPVKVTSSSGTDDKFWKPGSVKHGAGSQVASGSGDPPTPPPQEHQAPVPSTSGGHVQITVYPIFPSPRGDFPCTLYYATLHYTTLHYTTLHNSI